MGGRGLVVAAISTALVLGIDTAFAQQEETNVQNLPPVEIVAPQTTAKPKRSAPRTPAPANK